MIRDRLHVQPKAMPRIPFIDVDVSGARTVRRSVGIVGGNGILRTRLFHGNSDEFALRQLAKEPGKVGFHIANVTCVEVEQLLAGSGIEPALPEDVRVEACEIVEPQR